MNMRALTCAKYYQGQKASIFNKASLLLLQITDLEQDKRDLEKQVNELKAKCEQIEKRAAEQKSVDEKKHQEEISFLKRTNQQLKVSWVELQGSPVELIVGQQHSFVVRANVCECSIRKQRRCRSVGELAASSSSYSIVPSSRECYASPLTESKSEDALRLTAGLTRTKDCRLLSSLLFLFLNSRWNAAIGYQLKYLVSISIFTLDARMHARSIVSPPDTSKYCFV